MGFSVKVVAGTGSVKSSAGTKTAWTEVMDPFLVVVILSWRATKSVASVLVPFLLLLITTPLEVLTISIG